ncbi:MAG: tetratricopeptide repeat protein [Candidatus Melainabacteria bacterium]|nr:tetratricopeptide repeat protein [Candidatus Melainabacteria bacterium]
MSTSIFQFVVVCLTACSMAGCTLNEMKIPTKDKASDAALSPQWTKQTEWLEFQQDGEFLLSVQRFDKAEQAFLTAVKKAESFGARDARVARSKTGLARAYMGRRDWNKAVHFYGDALAIKKKSYGDNHTDVGDISSELARAYLSAGHPAEAKKMVADAKAIWKQLKLEAPAELVLTDAILASEDGNNVIAEQQFKKASDVLLSQIDLHKFPQPVTAMGTARESVDRYSTWLDTHGKPQLAKEYKAKIQPINEWLMILGESGV